MREIKLSNPRDRTAVNLVDKFTKESLIKEITELLESLVPNGSEIEWTNEFYCDGLTVEQNLLWHKFLKNKINKILN
jgi:hypothetical protein